MKLPISVLLLASTATCEESEGVSLLQTRAHVHVHDHDLDHANETRDECTDPEDEEASRCWPGMKFKDFLPAGCISQGATIQKRGNCDQLVTPSRVAAANKVLAKAGCITGYPNAMAWQQWIPSGEYKHTINKDSTAEDRVAAHARCIKYGEEDERCAGANVVTVAGTGCICWGGAVTFHRFDSAISCSVKSRPASENPRKYDAGTRKDAIVSIKETDSLKGCSEGWWVMAGGFVHPRWDGKFHDKTSGWLDQVQPLAQYRKPQHQWWNQKAYSQPPGKYADSDTPRQYEPPDNRGVDGAKRKPSDCAKSVQLCIDNQEAQCKDPITGKWPRGASMVAEPTRSYCKGWYGDLSEGVGAVTGQKAPEGALWPGEARWVCLSDGKDTTGGDMYLEGAKKSGKYKEGGKKEKPEKVETPEDFSCDLCADSENDFNPEGKRGKCKKINEIAQKSVKACEKRKARAGVQKKCCPAPPVECNFCPEGKEFQPDNLDGKCAKLAAKSTKNEEVCDKITSRKRPQRKCCK